jgi:hypothetical protein
MGVTLQPGRPRCATVASGSLIQPAFALEFSVCAATESGLMGRLGRDEWHSESARRGCAFRASPARWRGGGRPSPADEELLGNLLEPADTVAGLEGNTLADSFVHLATWVLVVVGMTAAIRAWQRGELAPP